MTWEVEYGDDGKPKRMYWHLGAKEIMKGYPHREEGCIVCGCINGWHFGWCSRRPKQQVTQEVKQP